MTDPSLRGTVGTPGERIPTYFDTSVYNRIADDSERAALLAAIRRTSDVWVSFWNLTELLDSAGSARLPRGRAEELLRVATDLMEDKELLAHPLDLLRRSIAALRADLPTLRFGFDRKVFADALSWDWLQHRPAEEIAAQKKWKAALRRADREWLARVRQDLELDHKGPHAVLGLDQILKAVFSNPERILFHFSDFLEWSGATPSLLADVEASVRRSMVWYPLMVAEMARRYLRITKRGESDVTDALHAVYLPCVTRFVTADDTQRRVFEETVRWCYPLAPKQVLSWDEHRRMLVPAGDDH